MTRHHREPPARKGAGHAVEVGLSFPFLAGPPPAVLRGEASLAETLHRTAAGDAHGALAESLLRHLPGAAPSRVYIGNETCERLLPSPEAIGSWAAAARGGRVALSLFLPPLSRDGLAKAEGVVRALEGVEDSEVVAGDWGTVHRLRSRHPGLEIVLGRLTHKMLRDPRLAEYFRSPEAPAAARSALCRSGELSPGYRSLMERYGIRRREIDPFLQPLEEDEWGGRSGKLSVHLPCQFVTMGRACLPGAMHQERTERFVPGGPCRMECRRHAVEFRLPDPGGNGGGKRLLALGNGFYHEVSPHVVERVLALLPSHPRVDRIVVSRPAGGERPC